MANCVRTEINGHVAEVVLDRPDKMNAISLELIDELIAAGEALMSRSDVRAVIVRGEGKAFCAGLDKSNFEKMLASGGQKFEDLRTRTHGDANRFQRVSLVWRDVPVPVICAVHGVALGGGFQIMLGADMRIASAQTRFSVMEMKWGLVPDMGGMVLMRELARADVIRLLTYTADVFDSERAHALGFVTELAEDPLARAREIASAIAGRSPSAIRAAKKLLNAMAERDRAGLLIEESTLQAELIGSADQIEAVMAEMQGRRPSFST